MTIRPYAFWLALALGLVGSADAQQRSGSFRLAEAQAPMSGAHCSFLPGATSAACPRPVRLLVPLGAEGRAEMSALRKAAGYYALANLAEGALGSFDPTVSGSDDDGDDLINTETGEILGISAINPAHAVLHLGWAGAGAWARRSDEASSTYMKASTVLFGALTAAGIARDLQTEEEIYYVAGMALDMEANLIHAAITGVAAYFGFVR